MCTCAYIYLVIALSFDNNYHTDPILRNRVELVKTVLKNKLNIVPNNAKSHIKQREMQRNKKFPTSKTA